LAWTSCKKLILEESARGPYRILGPYSTLSPVIGWVFETQTNKQTKILQTCEYILFKTTFMCPRSIVGVPLSQALPGYVITATPFVCVPAVIGVLACGFQTKKNQKTNKVWTETTPDEILTYISSLETLLYT